MGVELNSSIQFQKRVNIRKCRHLTADMRIKLPFTLAFLTSHFGNHPPKPVVDE